MTGYSLFQGYGEHHYDKKRFDRLKNAFRGRTTRIYCTEVHLALLEKQLVFGKYLLKVRGATVLLSLHRIAVAVICHVSVLICKPY